VNLYRAIQAYAHRTALPSVVAYYHRATQWDNFSYITIVTLLVWHADALVIFRSFIIWGRDYRVIVVPVLLLFLCFVVNVATFARFRNPNILPAETLSTLRQMIYPINIAQSTLTTCLIVLKIWTQHAQSQSAGLPTASGSVKLLTIVRIVVESASIFTIQQIILLIFQQVKHPASVILHATLVPSIGIVFVLMTLRTHLAKSE
ncbi:hypothetical protein FA13DRAFT_1607268, partial [Coprinellus micaceus]